MEMNELAEEIFKQAISHQLYDIHLLPIGEEYVFYLRDVNGLKELRKVSTKIAEQFISYLKYQAGMDVGERRRPQSGSLTFEFSVHQSIELRLSIITNFKQKGPIISPAAKYPNTEPKPIRLNNGTATTAAPSNTTIRTKSPAPSASIDSP